MSCAPAEWTRSEKCAPARGNHVDHAKGPFLPESSPQVAVIRLKNLALETGVSEIARFLEEHAKVRTSVSEVEGEERGGRFVVECNLELFWRGDSWVVRFYWRDVLVVAEEVDQSPTVWFKSGLLSGLD